MTVLVETDDQIPAWLPTGVLDAIRNDATLSDPGRAERFASVDADRVRQAIDRGDEILAAHRCFGDDEVVDRVLARAALIVARALVRPRTDASDGF